MRRCEQVIHKAVVGHLKVRGVPGLVWFHPPNGGYRRPIEAAIMKSMGTKAGVSDLILFHDSKFFCLELKAEGGRATEAQMTFLADAGRAGAFTAIAEGLDRALAVLQTWGLLRGTTA